MIDLLQLVLMEKFSLSIKGLNKSSAQGEAGNLR